MKGLLARLSLVAAGADPGGGEWHGEQSAQRHCACAGASAAPLPVHFLLTSPHFQSPAAAAVAGRTLLLAF
eukprot:4585514-Pleurochrysis_carterae.AAC.1